MRRPRGHWLKVSSPLFLFPPSLPRVADTYHDFRPACAVGVSSPRQHCLVVVMMRLRDEFDMMIQSSEFVGGTVLVDLPGYGGVKSTEGFFTISNVLMSLVVLSS